MPTFKYAGVVEERWTNCESVPVQGERGPPGEVGERVSSPVLLFLSFLRDSIDSEMLAISVMK